MLNINRNIILASKSPRRKKLLEQIGLEFAIVPSTIDEKSILFDCNFAEFSERLALLKATEVARRSAEDNIVIGADTIVVVDNQIMNKPIDEADARRMLQLLSDRTHTVHTGIALVEAGSLRSLSGVQSTDVTFRKLEANEIDEYIQSGSPMDKAGSYGIQDDYGAVFVSRIVGCYYNIVGLPLEKLFATLKQFINSLEKTI